MAVLAASICTHGGKALLSRQFKDLSKDRVTALLANFPSLLSNSGSQNTSVEDESVRYVYQPLEELYVVLVTNKQSNILQDIDTLHLFVSVVSNMVRTVDEKEVLENAFEMLSAFDEIVTLGYKEKLTLLQVQTFLEMDSHEEKIQEIIERNKELEALEERRRRAKEIQRKELARRNLELQAQAPQPAAMSSETYGYAPAPPTYETSVESDVEALQPARGGRGGRGLQLGRKPAREQTQPLLNVPVLVSGQNSAGSSVRGATGGNNTPSGVAGGRAAAPGNFAGAPSGVSAPGTNMTPTNGNTGAPAANGGRPVNNGVLITVNEKVSAQVSRDGAISSLEVKGDLQLRINDPDLAHAKILLNVGHGSVQYKTHPNVDRAAFGASGVIALKDQTKLFPSNDQSLGVLRWRATAPAGDASLVPLVVTAWVSVSGGVAEVTLEYEVTSSYIEAHATQELLDDVTITVPVALQEVDLRDDLTGSVSYNVDDSGVVFTVGSVAFSDPHGSFEFAIPAYDEELLFPMAIGFDVVRTEGVTEADTAFGQVQVVDVVSNDADETSLPFDLHLRMESEDYVVS